MNNLTLVMPTYNRPEHLKRLLTYYQSSGIQSEFLILDSSSEATQAENKASVSSCGERFQHVVFPSSMPVAAKLFRGLELVKTSYCAVCADDDLIFPDALRKAHTFLSAHPDYVCADGIYLNFAPLNGEINFQIEYASRGITSNHPGARVFQLFQRYESVFYAVFRTHDLRDVFSFVKEIPTLHYQELFQAAAALLKGRSYRLSEFYAARQACDPAEPNRDKWQTFFWFADDTSEFLSHYQDYRDDLWRFYQKFCSEPRMSQKSFFRAMDMAHAVFFSAGCSPPYFYARLQQYWPQDVLKNLHDSDELEDLKGKFRRKIDGILNSAALALKFRGFLHYYKPTFLAEIPKKRVVIGKNKGKEWACLLPRDISWVTSKPQFRSAFLELCKYLGNVENGLKPQNELSLRRETK